MPSYQLASHFPANDNPVYEYSAWREVFPVTAQEPDILQYEGKRFGIIAIPLEQYFGTDTLRPNFVPESTSNRRGYVAEWEIRADWLYLTGLSGRICVKPAEVGGQTSPWCQGGHLGACDIRSASLESIFGVHRELIFADWFTGEITAPHGKMIEYVHMAYASRFERYLIFDLEDGIVDRTRILGDEQFEAEWKERWEAQKKARKENEKRWWRFW